MKKFYIVLLSFTFIFLDCELKAQLEYKDVAHIFHERCTTCHHEGQHAPSMMNYSQIAPLTWSIQNDLQQGRMPPWFPDTTYSRFVPEHIISQAEKNEIITWINGGFIKGDTTLAPPAPIYSQYALIGTPSLILKIPPFTSNAGSADAYNCFSLPSGLTQDRVLRAYEIVPGNSLIVHHVLVGIDTNGTTPSDLSGTCYNAPGDIGIGGYAPGAPPTVFPGQAPLKAGIRIKAGSNIILQIHYPPGTIGQVDSTQIRLYFYPLNETGIRTMYNFVPLQNWNLYIPANTTPTYTAQYPPNGGLTAPISVFATFPHSHKVCKTITNCAYNGTDTIPLIRIKKWDFNWQGYYTFPKLVKVPAGYKLFSSHLYDNTTNNPNNPHTPPALVIAGVGTNDEMLFDSFLFLPYQAGDDSIDIASLLTHDSLLNPLGVNEISSTSGLQAFIYPNPASDKVSIHLSKKSEYKAQILNITGQTILPTETVFTDDAVIDVKNVPAGLYILEITDTKKNDRITKKIMIAK